MLARRPSFLIWVERLGVVMEVIVHRGRGYRSPFGKSLLCLGRRHWGHAGKRRRYTETFSLMLKYGVQRSVHRHPKTVSCPTMLINQRNITVNLIG